MYFTTDLDMSFGVEVDPFHPLVIFLFDLAVGEHQVFLFQVRITISVGPLFDVHQGWIRSCDWLLGTT